MADKKEDVTVKTVTPKPEPKEEKALTQKDLDKAIQADYQKGVAVDDIIKKYGDKYPMKKAAVMKALGFPENEIAPYQDQ